MKTKTTFHHKLAAAFTMGMFAGSSGDAFAGTATTIRTMTDNIVVSSGGYQNLISTVCWIGGSGLGVAGIFKLKQHVDNPGQAPMKDGLIRIACGGGLLAFPFIQTAMQGSISNGSMAKLDATQLRMDSVSTFIGP